MIGRRVVAIAGVLAAGYVALHRLGRTSGSTAGERRRTLPGDELVAHAQFVTDHAATIDGPPEAVWPWLAQMGWHRAGWYTARWVDLLLFPANEAAADRIHPEWQELAVGDRILDGAPETECWFVVEDLAPDRHLVLHSRSHLPPDLRDRFGAAIDWTWTFVLGDLGDGRTRLHFRSRAALAPWWLRAGYWLALVPADHVMSRQMLRGIRDRAEGRLLEEPASNRAPELARALGLMLVTPALRPLHLRWGATAQEAADPMPGDELVPRAHFRATRAITIDAPPHAVWPWLLQVGVGRAGFYSYDLLDNRGQPSATEPLPDWQALAVGDVIAPMTAQPTTATTFRVAALDEPNTLVWSKPDSTWAWRLTPVDGGRTRLVTRLKVRYRLAPDALVTVPLIELGDFAMMRRMLLTLRRRVEAREAARLA